jgi:hypothetical protein
LHPSHTACPRNRDARLIHALEDVNGGPAVCGHDAWVGAALEERGEQVAVFFVLGAPQGRELLQDMVV